MHRWTDLSQVPPGFGPSVVTIGNFDGVHRGHVEVLTRIVDDARATGSKAVAVTFHPHPASVHRPDQAPDMITGIADRLELMAYTGLDSVLLLEYTLDLARNSPEEFVVTYLVRGLNARKVVVGHDVRFGWGNVGTLDTMVDLGRRYGFEVEPIDDVGTGTTTDGGRWSSTYVRELLGGGRAAEVAEVLGRFHSVRGKVVHGDARGRELGFPTANLAPEVSGLVPADGVYAGWLIRPQLAAADPSHPDIALPAAISVGTNPTFDGAERRVEAYVLDRKDLDLYDEDVVVEFVALLRPMVRFDGLEALVEQMRRDVQQARDVLQPGQAPGRSA